MNGKVTTNSQLSTNEPKRKEKQQKLSKTQNRNRIREMDITQREFSGEGDGRNGGNSTGKKKHNLVSIK